METKDLTRLTSTISNIPFSYEPNTWSFWFGVNMHPLPCPSALPLIPIRADNDTHDTPSIHEWTVPADSQVYVLYGGFFLITVTLDLVNRRFWVWRLALWWRTRAVRFDGAINECSIVPLFIFAALSNLVPVRGCSDENLVWLAAAIHQDSGCDGTLGQAIRASIVNVGVALVSPLLYVEGKEQLFKSPDVLSHLTFNIRQFFWFIPSMY